MTDAELDAYVAASARALGIPMDRAWREAVKANLAVAFRMGALVAAFPLPDEAESAPVFGA